MVMMVESWDLCRLQVQHCGVNTSRSTPSTFSATSTLDPSSTLPSMTSSSSMTSNGGAIERWPLGDSVDGYEKMLQREHQGWTAAFREESQCLPMDGDEGGRQGQLMSRFMSMSWRRSRM